MASLDLHMGAHKTATTYIQRLFYNNRARIRAEGIAIPHHRKTRKFLTIPVQLKSYERIGQNWNRKFTDTELDIIIRSFLEAQEQQSGVERVFLTDENLLGHCGHIVRSGILYNRKQVFLETLKEFLPRTPDRIFLSFREYASFYSAVYAQYLADVKPENFVSQEDFALMAMKRYPNWANLLKTVQSAFPETELVVWPYEKMNASWTSILAKMLSPSLAKTLDVGDVQVARKSMSQRSYLEFQQALKSKGVSYALDALGDIRKAHDTDVSGRLNIFSQDETGELDRRYKKHLKQMEAPELRITRVA